MSNIRTKLLRPVSGKRYWLLLGCLVVFFAVIYFGQALRVIAPWDPSDMIIQGRSLAQGHGFQYYDANNERIGPYFNSTGFVIHAPGDPQPYNVFPPGLGLIVAAWYKLGVTLDQVYLIAPLCGVLGLLGIAYVGYALNGCIASLAAVLLLGVSQTYVQYATSIWSDGPSVSLLLIGLAVYYRAFQTKRPVWAALSGLLLGLFILLRYANIVYVLLILGHAAVFSQGRERWTLIGWLLPGIMAGSGYLLFYQWQSYGGPFTNAYQAWGKPFWDSGPLFSLSYLIFKTPAPWNDYTLNFILEAFWLEMRLWVLVCLASLLINRHSSLKLLVALILLVTILIYGTSMFTTRRLPSERYLLPALGAAYLLTADVVSRLWYHAKWPSLRLGLGAAVLITSLAGLLQQLPALYDEYTGITQYVSSVKEMSQSLPVNSVVLAYGGSSTFILYGDVSALNYRRLEAADHGERIRKVTQAVQDLLSRGQSVYLFKDEEVWFNLIYPELEQSFILKAVSAPLPLFEVTQQQDGHSTYRVAHINRR